MWCLPGCLYGATLCRQCQNFLWLCRVHVPLAFRFWCCLLSNRSQGCLYFLVLTSDLSSYSCLEMSRIISSFPRPPPGGCLLLSGDLCFELPMIGGCLSLCYKLMNLLMCGSCCLDVCWVCGPHRILPTRMPFTPVCGACHWLCLPGLLS